MALRDIRCTLFLYNTKTLLSSSTLENCSKLTITFILHKIYQEKIARAKFAAYEAEWGIAPTRKSRVKKEVTPDPEEGQADDGEEEDDEDDQVSQSPKPRLVFCNLGINHVDVFFSW